MWSASVCISPVNRTRVQAWRQNGHSHGSELGAVTAIVVEVEEEEEDVDEDAVVVEDAADEDEGGAVVAGVELAVEGAEDDAVSFFFFFTNNFSLSEHVAHICNECGHDAMVWWSMGDTQIRQSGCTEVKAEVGDGCAADEAGAAVSSCDGNMLAADDGGSIGVGRCAVRSRSRGR